MRLAALLACAPLAAPLAAEPISASAYNLLLEPYALIVDAGTERGIFVAHGLEPRWITREKRAVNASDLKDLLAQGTGVGLSSPSEIFFRTRSESASSTTTVPSPPFATNSRGGDATNPMP